MLLGRNGFVNALLQGLGFSDEPVKLLFTEGAVFVCLLQLMMPLRLDHRIFVGRVERFTSDLARAPLVYHGGRYRQLARDEG